MVESALNIRKELFGRKSLPTADSLFQLANLTQLSGVLSEAMSLHIVALDMRTQFLCADTFTYSPTNSSGLRRHQSMCDSLLAVGGLKVVLSHLEEGGQKIRFVTAVCIDSTAHRQ